MGVMPLSPDRVQLVEGTARGEDWVDPARGQRELHRIVACNVGKRD
jgi:hypothetical protein